MPSLDDATALVDALTPSRTGNDYRWKVFISISTGLLIVTISAHILWACGFLAFMGMPGFANADDVKVQSRKLDILEANQIDGQIMDTRQRQCKMMQVSPRNDDALTFYTQRLGERMSRYRQLVGADYRLPSCDEL